MNRKDFLSQLELSPPSEWLLSFDGIPTCDLNEDVVATWFSKAISKYPSDACRIFSEIPLKYLNDSIRSIAIEKSYRVLAHIKPSHTDIYCDLVILALRQVNISDAYLLVDESYRNSDLISKLIDKVPYSMPQRWDDIGWVSEAFTPELIRKNISDPIFTMNLPEERLTWEEWKDIFTTIPDCAYLLEDLPNMDLFQRFLNEGGWPQDDDHNGVIFSLVRTNDLNKLVKLLDNSPEDGNEHYVYRAKIKTFPIDEVVQVMNSASRAKILIQMYPSDVLRPFRRLSRFLRGALLESDLGM